MTTSALAERLLELDGLLRAHPFAVRQLRAAASPIAIAETAARLGVGVPATLRTLYEWRDGAMPEPGGWELFLFLPYWQYLPLSRVEREAEWPLEWSRAAGVEGLPFAMDPSGQFLVAQSGPEDVVVQVSSDFVTAAWPDGTMLGLIESTCQALRRQHVEYVADFSDDKMEWVYPNEATTDE